ncbi:hypothetical protein CCACVL1_20230, partial [Corchorus capsularis]
QEDCAEVVAAEIASPQHVAASSSRPQRIKRCSTLLEGFE